MKVSLDVEYRPANACIRSLVILASLVLPFLYLLGGLVFVFLFVKTVTVLVELCSVILLSWVQAQGRSRSDSNRLMVDLCFEAVFARLRLHRMVALRSRPR